MLVAREMGRKLKGLARGEGDGGGGRGASVFTRFQRRRQVARVRLLRDGREKRWKLICRRERLDFKVEEVGDLRWKKEFGGWGKGKKKTGQGVGSAVWREMKNRKGDLWGADDGVSVQSLES